MTDPPSGAAPPASADLPGHGVLDLRALAEEICARYRAEFPDEQERYGDAGMAWCVHDNQYLVNWAVIEASGLGGFERHVVWLAGVLAAREFPLARLARDLEIAAAVLEEAGARRPAEILADGARSVRAL